MPQPQTFLRLRSPRRDGMTTMAATTPWPCPYCGAILGAHTSGLFLFLIKMLLPRRLSFSMGGWFISSLNTFTLPFNLVFQPLEIPSSTLFWSSVSDNQQSAPWLRMNSSVWTVPHWQAPHGLLHLLPQPRQSWLQHTAILMLVAIADGPICPWVRETHCSPATILHALLSRDTNTLIQDNEPNQPGLLPPGAIALIFSHSQNYAQISYSILPLLIELQTQESKWFLKILRGIKL